jgi:HEPN domain-containing protein
MIARGSAPFHDQRCFHCQQAAEKYLKALLQELGLPVPRTHQLLDLLHLLLPHYSSLRSFRRGLDFLTRFAVDIRYPGTRARKRQAEAASRWTAGVRAACRGLLGILPRRSRRKKSP